MDAACLRHTDLPHTSRLFADFLYHFDRVRQFYSHNPADFNSFAAAAGEIEYPAERRAALVAALRVQNGDSPSLELLAKPNTVAVVTGQQVGLFSGPAYTIYKALSAVRLAAELSANNVPAVPIFWLATEDHDFAEVDHAWVFGKAQQPIGFHVDGKNTGQRPVGGVELESIPIDELRKALSDLPFGSEVTDLVAAAYPAGVTLGEGFRRLLQSLLSRYGILYLDPLHADIRKIAAPILRQAAASASELKARLLERNKELAAAGYHAQVHIEPRTSLFFLLDNGKRITLRQQEQDYVAKDHRYSPAELAERAEELSPNALLRPVIQDYLLPTVSYVGGPAELAYMAQGQVLYQSLLGRMPVMTARSGFTILDSRADKLMRRYHLTLPAILKGDGALRESISRAIVPPALHQRVSDTTAEVSRQLGRLRQDFLAFDPTLASALDKSGAKILYQLEKIGQKAGREALRRDQRAIDDAEFLTGLIDPQKHLQERFYSILPFLAKHGLDLIDQIYENVRVDCHDHQLLVV